VVTSGGNGGDSMEGGSRGRGPKKRVRWRLQKKMGSGAIGALSECSQVYRKNGGDL